MNQLFSKVLTFVVSLTTASMCLANAITPPDVHRTVQITTIDYPPLMGPEEGLMTDLVRAAFNSQSYSVNFVIVPMARIPWSITHSNSDAVIGSILWFKEKEVIEKISFQTIYYSGVHFFYRKAQFPAGITYDELTELDQYKVGYIQSGSILRLLNESGIHPQLVKDLTTNTRKLKTKRIDMFIATELGGWGAIKKIYPDKVAQFAMTPRPILDMMGSGDILFPNKSRHLKEIFAAGFSQLKDDGTYLKILEQYYGKGHIPENLLTLKLRQKKAANPD